MANKHLALWVWCSGERHADNADSGDTIIHTVNKGKKKKNSWDHQRHEHRLRRGPEMKGSSYISERIKIKNGGLNILLKIYKTKTKL